MKAIRWLCAAAVLAAILTMVEGSAAAQSCRISTTPVSFGVYNVFTPTDLPSTGSIRYQCNNLLWTVLTVYLSKGSAPSNNPRQMSRGSERLSYNLYLDAAHTRIWGDPNPDAYQRFYWFLNANPDVTLTVYGLIPAQQDVAAGSYSDSVVATVNF